MRHTFKTLAIAAGVSLVALGTGFAADLGARPVYKAPPAPAPMFSWTGFYIGGHAGYGWGRNDFTDTAGSVGAVGATYGNDTDGFLGGVQAGFDYQFAPNWVLGIEGQVSWANIDGSTGYVPALFPTTFSNNVDWISSVTGRLGFTPGSNWLIYGKGGVAWADFDQTVSTAAATVTNSQTRTGWTAGAGIEYAFAPGWSAKVEYQYYDFGKDTYDFSPVGGAAGFGPFDVDSQIHTVKAGINWRFGGLGGMF
jgi:outer membrane immunogenic protein